MPFVFEFEWDVRKATANLKKHAVDFKTAVTVFSDELAATIPDDDHSDQEERWVTLGRDRFGGYVLVIHTFVEIAPDRASVRIISARRPTRVEIRQYEEMFP
jgi:hypothetical protein